MRWLTSCGIVVPVIDVVITIWLGAQNPGYSHVRQYISELGEAGRPYSGPFSVWFVSWGVLFAAFAVGLVLRAGRQKGTCLGPGAALVLAASSVVVSIFPLRCGRQGHVRFGKRAPGRWGDGSTRP